MATQVCPLGFGGYPGVIDCGFGQFGELPTCCDTRVDVVAEAV